LKKTIIILLILNANFIIGQNNDSRIELPEFLVGMFNDYNGKQFIPGNLKKSELVTTFYCSQKELYKLFVDSLKTLNKEWNFNIEVENTGFIEVYSAGFSEFFKRYYKTSLNADFSYTDENNMDYEIYVGQLNKKLFKSQNQKFSFIIGAFLRYGTFLGENKVRLDFANSPNHFKIVQVFLRKLNFKILKVSKCEKPMTPCGQTITFELNKKYKPIFEKLELIRPTIYDQTDCE
jgi:hypothetical protein